MSKNTNLLSRTLTISFLSLFFAIGFLAIKLYPNENIVTETALAYKGQCSTSNGYSCPSGKTCSCPESTFDWNNNQDAGDCDCVDIPPTNQEPCVHTICPVGYRCYDPGGGEATYCIDSGGNTPTRTPTTSQTASCLNVKAYNPSNWTVYTATQLGQLRAGNNVYFCAAGSTNVGSFSKAQFTINGTARAETATQRPNTVNEYCDLYTIPANTFTFNIDAKLFHTTLGWIQ